MRYFSNLILVNLIIAYVLCIVPSFTTLAVTEELFGQDFAPVKLKADLLSYDSSLNAVTASGNVYVIMDNYTLKADSLSYYINKDVLFAEGNIIISDNTGKIILGKRAVFRDKLKQGIIDEFVAKFPDNILLVAAYAEREGLNKASFYKASFTPCKISCGHQPLWQIKATDTRIDYEKEKVIYKNAFFEVFGLPVLYIPYFSHPTPNARAQSGMLVPSIKKDDLVLPFYFRAKPNIDLTISPRFAKNYVITEGQFRHLLKSGSYKINGSYGNPSRKKAGKIAKNHRYHVFANGNFYNDNIYYGFDANRASDKAYLTNYFDIYDTFLESKLYANKVDYGDYFSLESYYFQGFRTEDKNTANPFIFPRIRVQKLTELDDDGTIFLTVKNETLAYNEDYKQQAARNALDLNLSKNVITPNGHLFNFALANRNDFYWIDSKDSITKVQKEKTLHRNIPELQTKWLYPLTKNISQNVTVKLEPIVAIVVGKNYKKSYDEFVIIDFAKYELSEYNLFNPNRFNAVDYHEYGRRLSYGVNASLFSGMYYFDAFLGQLIYNDNPVAKTNADYVGNVSLDLIDSFKLYYRFSRDKRLHSLRDEIGARTWGDKISTDLAFSSLSNIARYYSASQNLEPNKISQINCNIGYQVLDSVKIDTGVRVDVTSRARIMQRSIKVTYLMDCVSITGKIYDDFTHDSIRGVKKQKSKSFALGFKVLNM